MDDCLCDTFKYCVTLYSPTVFQEFMHEVLREYLHCFGLVYINIFVYSQSMAEHRQHISEVLQPL